LFAAVKTTPQHLTLVELAANRTITEDWIESKFC
jgi:hypothetical protein